MKEGRARQAATGCKFRFRNLCVNCDPLYPFLISDTLRHSAAQSQIWLHALWGDSWVQCYTWEKERGGREDEREGERERNERERETERDRERSCL